MKNTKKVSLKEKRVLSLSPAVMGDTDAAAASAKTNYYLSNAIAKSKAEMYSPTQDDQSPVSAISWERETLNTLERDFGVAVISRNGRNKKISIVLSEEKIPNVYVEAYSLKMKIKKTIEETFDPEKYIIKIFDTNEKVRWLVEERLVEKELWEAMKQIIYIESWQRSPVDDAEIFEIINKKGRINILFNSSFYNDPQLKVNFEDMFSSLEFEKNYSTADNRIGVLTVKRRELQSANS